MSAIGGKADMPNVGYSPKEDIAENAYPVLLILTYSDHFLPRDS